MSEAFDSALSKFVEDFGPDAISTILLSWTPRLIAAIVVFAVLAGVLWIVTRALTAVFKRVGLDQTAAAFVQNVTRFGILTVAILMALAQLGVDTTSILASLGVLGLTLGFAAQNTLSNVISGLFIFWDRPFVIGDLVEADGEYGRVETITLRSTRLITVDGRMISLPNTVMANQKVASYTNFPHLRLDIDVTVGVQESLDRVRALMLSTVKGDERFMTEPQPVVHVKSLNDYNVLVTLKAWILDERAHIELRSHLRQRVKETLDSAGVEMPFETLALAPLSIQNAPSEA